MAKLETKIKFWFEQKGVPLSLPCVGTRGEASAKLMNEGVKHGPGLTMCVLTGDGLISRSVYGVLVNGKWVTNEHDKAAQGAEQGG